jgi:CHASE2 domain-containing sensor protein
MTKLVVLTVTEGSFAKGFSIQLEIGEENAYPTVNTLGRLPPLPEMPLYYDRWRTLYDGMGAIFRIKARKQTLPNLPSRRKACRNAAKFLEKRLNAWHESEDYRPIREKWLEQLSPDEEIRVILRTEDAGLRRLPWNLLDFMKRYPKAEITLSALQWQAVQAPPRSPQPISILAILGDSSGIDVQVDRALLNSLPQAEVTFLVEPSRKEVNNALWSRPWDMVFFAGHSTSESGNGRIFINKTDSLTIAELNYALQQAVAAGLKFAIFNSCDGLGLTPGLADLQIPQVIVMREPVPDSVAQEFLKYFLHSFSGGKSFVVAFREARERLQHLEDQHPCATWLPVICQNPAVVPPTWKELVAAPEPEPELDPQPSVKRRLAIAALASLACTVLISGIRYAGVLQPYELLAFDALMRQRPPEPPDPRLLIVKIDGEDFRQQFSQKKPGEIDRSISDQSLLKLLQVLNAHQPRVVGLDVYYDRSPGQAYPDLLAQLKTNENLVVVCKASYTKVGEDGIKPPPDVPLNSDRITFSDFIEDESDDVMRRQLLAMPISNQSDPVCPASYAFNTELALRYLAPYQTNVRVEPDWTFKIGLGKQPSDTNPVSHGFLSGAVPAGTAWQPYQAVFPPLQGYANAYQGISNGGTQLLLNYRMTPDLIEIAESRPLRWFLSNPPKADLDRLVKNKIVLIGVTIRQDDDSFKASGFKDDYFKTPYGYKRDDWVPGVFIHAHMVSQLLSHVLDGRPLLWVWNPWTEGLWIAGWALVGGVLTGVLGLQTAAIGRLLPQVALMLGLATATVYGTCVGVLVLFGGWLPLVPPMLVLFASSGTVMMLSAQRIRAVKSTY